MTHPPGIFTTFVTEAILGKYPECPESEIAEQVAGAYGRISGHRSLDELLHECRPIDGASEDINNQVAALIAISEFSANDAFRRNPMTLLYRIAYAADPSGMRRTTRAVEGYPGDLATPVSEAEARFQELEGLVRTLAGTQVGEVGVAAHLLAHVFSATIRIHYFKDGNGRVARLTVQYLLRAWGAPFLALPKVRNDPAWKQALSDALDGDVSALAAIYVERLNQSAGGAWGKPIL